MSLHTYCTSHWHSPTNHTTHILCTSSLVPLSFFHQWLTYAHNAPSRYFSFSGSFATLFLSWQPLLCGECVRLFVSVCGYVWKCVRMCLWVSVLECWVRGRANSLTKCKDEHLECLLSVCVHVDVSVHWSANETKLCPSAHAFKKTSQWCLSFLRVFSDQTAPTPSCWILFCLFFTPGDRTWGLECPVGSRPAPLPTSHPPPLVVAILAANFPLML